MENHLGSKAFGAMGWLVNLECSCRKPNVNTRLRSSRVLILLSRGAPGLVGMGRATITAQKKQSLDRACLARFGLLTYQPLR